MVEAVLPPPVIFLLSLQTNLLEFWLDSDPLSFSNFQLENRSKMKVSDEAQGNDVPFSPTLTAVHNC